MQKDYSRFQEILEKYNQEHIMKHLKENNKEELINQILNIDFEEISELYEETKKEAKIDIENIEPVNATNSDKLIEEQICWYKKIGSDTIKDGKFAVSIMAGGQGTRLGHEGPKGSFKLDVGEKGKYLFELIVDKLKKAKEDYGVYIYCYIMTSRENNLDTIEFFEKNEYFGYPKTHIKFFMQGEMPLIDENGKLLIGENNLIKLASNGNGGIFNSMLKAGVLKDLEEKNIDWVFIGSVDNALVPLVDDLLLGLAIESGNQIATKTIIKNDPHEKVGVFCKSSGKVKVIEYTEIPEKMVEALDENGEMLFGESHIMCNLFSLDALKKASTKELKYHIAHKKSAYLDENGQLIKPSNPNCYKFEKFIFDAFTLFDNITILRGKREEVFAPIKNAEGIDSPQTAKKLYEEYWQIKSKCDIV